MRKHFVKNYVTGRWVLTVKRDKEGNFQKVKARWVLRGFLDKQQSDLQTDSPTSTRPGFRLQCQIAANEQWDITHIDLRTAFLQGEAYDSSREVVCQLPPEAGYPPYWGGRLIKPAYGLNDAPRKWWNRLDKSLRGYGLIPTRADRCCYVLYGDAQGNAHKMQARWTPSSRTRAAGGFVQTKGVKVDAPDSGGVSRSAHLVSTESEFGRFPLQSQGVKLDVFDSGHIVNSFTPKLDLQKFDTQEMNFTYTRPLEARTFLSTPHFRKKLPVSHLKGRASDYAYYLHERVQVHDENDYIFPEHAIPIYKQNVLNYMTERCLVKLDNEYQDLRYCALGTEDNDHLSYLTEIDETIEYMLDPISGSAAKGKKVLGIICIHVDDVFMTGCEHFNQLIVSCLKRDFEIGSQDVNDVMYCGQRVRWVNKGQKDAHITVDQDLKVEELEEIKVPEDVKAKGPAEQVLVTGSELHSAFRSLLGKINWLQNRTRFDACYRFSRCASNSSSPSVADINDLNMLCRKIRSQHIILVFHPLKKKTEENWRLVGYPDASYNNNADKSSQRGLCIFLAEPRRTGIVNARGSLVEYESHKIRKVTQSTQSLNFMPS